jgi:small GTP-binding protein
MSRQYKVCTIGSSNVGKTSLILRLIRDKYKPSVDPTLGLSFLTKQYVDNAIELQIWDTAGQERFDSMLPSYLRNANIILLCTDAETMQEFDVHVQRYLQKIPDNSDAHVMICTTKFDRASGVDCVDKLSDMDYLGFLERYEPMRAYCNGIGLDYHTTSAKTGWGFIGLQQVILNVCQRITPKQPNTPKPPTFPEPAPEPAKYCRC